jgi:hypothetical protein
MNEKTPLSQLVLTAIKDRPTMELGEKKAGNQDGSDDF